MLTYRCIFNFGGLMTNIIYYSTKSENLNLKIKLECKNKVNSFDYELDFLRLLGRIKNEHPDILIFNHQEYILAQNQMNIFAIGSAYYVPIVLIASNIFEQKTTILPTNYTFVRFDEIVSCLDNFEHDLKRLRYNSLKIKELTMGYDQFIYNTLIDMGFNGSTKGTHFLKSSIAQTITSKCIPSAFSNVYTQVGMAYSSTPACVHRCVRSAIITAWEHKDQIQKADAFVSFAEFSHCPKAKEFIYYIANKIYMRTQSQLLKNTITF